MCIPFLVQIETVHCILVIGDVSVSLHLRLVNVDFRFFRHQGKRKHERLIFARIFWFRRSFCVDSPAGVNHGSASSAALEFCLRQTAEGILGFHSGKWMDQSHLHICTKSKGELELILGESSFRKPKGQVRSWVFES